VVIGIFVATGTDRLVRGRGLGTPIAGEADTLSPVAADEVNQLARAVGELQALLRTQGDQAAKDSQTLDRLSGTLSQVAMLIEDLQERVARLEDEQHRGALAPPARERG
jgi:ABC-type transporter Mla subunit MlaD